MNDWKGKKLIVVDYHARRLPQSLADFLKGPRDRASIYKIAFDVQVDCICRYLFLFRLFRT